MSKILITICISLILASTSYAYVPMVIGNWENTSGDGWGGWISNSVVPANPLPITLSNGVTYSQSTIGATLGSYSLDVAGSGWKQSLAIALNPSQVTAFFGNTTLQFDVSVAASGGVYSSGYSQLVAVWMNASGPGWTEVAGNSGNILEDDWWSSSPARTNLISVNYQSFAQAAAGSSWVQIIIGTNTGGGAPADMYFDSVQLTPEPATMALLGLGGLALIRRKR